MSADAPKTWGLFGGAGFIGQHLALSILERHANDRVMLLDLLLPEESGWKTPLEEFGHSGRLLIQRCDVRDEGQLQALDTRFDVIVNLAAIHREPGHRADEYFETNVPGARNLCELARQTSCSEIIFTSSISVYGIHDRPVDESTTPQPYSPYGQSKLKAEEIHMRWAQENSGRLSIIRPGVVFGPGESGNVTRLVREMQDRNRAIELQPDQRKAGIYIRELIDLVHWLRGQGSSKPNVQLVNGVSHELLTFNAFGQALQQVRKFEKDNLKIPARAVRMASLCTRPLARFMPPGWRFHPERLAKIYRPNDVRPAALESMAYPFSWPLERALPDWLKQGL